MTNKLEISRELAAVLADDHAPYQQLIAAKERLRALLAAPVVERQEPAVLMERAINFVAFVAKCVRKNGEYAPLHRQKMEELDRDLKLYTSQPAPESVSVTPSLWEICIRDEPGNPESPCEYVYVNNELDRDSILRRGGAYICAEYACLDKELNQ